MESPASDAPGTDHETGTRRPSEAFGAMDDEGWDGKPDAAMIEEHGERGS